MVLRLMNYRADITCAMDWWQNRDATVALPADLQTKSHQPKPSIPQGYKLQAPIADSKSADQTNPIVFYDIWVSRDVQGAKFWWAYPFLKDEDSQRAVRKGLPFRASCCWNGLVVLNAEPFSRGVRFRSHITGECRASECTLMCEDFARLGYQYVVVDAGVQVTYELPLAREMMAAGVEGVGQTTWSQVKAAGAVAQAAVTPAYQQMECCSLGADRKWVNFYTDCSAVDVMKSNFTAQALARSSTPFK
eukprot:gene9880-10038_t